MARTLNIAVGTPAPPTSEWPDASNTGVPAGTLLTTVSGGINLSTPGMIYQERLINGGYLVVGAANVTIRRCKLIANESAAIINESTGLLIEDCEIDMGMVEGRTGITPGDYTARRCNIHGGENLVYTQGNTTLEDCYLHTPVEYTFALDPHTDCIQVPIGVPDLTFSHNTIFGDFRYPNVSDGGPANDGFGSSCITFGASPSNVLIEDNLFAGAGFCLRLADATGATDLVVTGNRWTNTLCAAMGYPERYAGFGEVTAMDVATTWSDNIFLDGPREGDPVTD